MSPASVFARYRPLIDDWQAFSAALERPLPACAWTNTLRTTAEALARRLAAGGVAATPLPWLPGAFRWPEGLSPGARLEFVAGLYHLQEEVSLLPVALLDPLPGERVLDLCAAPGGKTAQIAVAMGNRGTVLANDRDMPRLHTVRGILDRLGAVNVTVTSWDGANYPSESGPFDRVLADVPCTCEGTSRKSPEVLELAGLGGWVRLSGVQRALLRKAIALCRPGGRVVYSTCTYAPEENELVVAEVLEELPPGSVRLLPARLEGFRGAPGLTSWQDRELPAEMERALRVWPHHNDTGGFFVAVLEKRGEPPPRGRSGIEGRATVVPGPSGVCEDGAQGTPKGARSAFEHRPQGTPDGPPREPPEAALPERGEPVPPDFWRPFLEQRFGLGPEAFAGLRTYRRSGRLLAVVAEDHRPPRRPRPYVSGLPLLHLDTLAPKLTTAAAMAFGPRATRNVIAADAEQADAYLRRRPFALDEEQEAAAAPGQVLVRHGGVVLGLGLLRRGDGGAMVESLFPKRWAPGGEGLFPGLEVGE